MPITIHPPVVEDVGTPHADYDSMSVDSDGGVEFEDSRPNKRPSIGVLKVGTGIVTPGEVVTDDPQWMRLVFTCRAKHPLRAPLLTFFTLQRPWYLHQSIIYIHYRNSRRKCPENEQIALRDASPRPVYPGNR